LIRTFVFGLATEWVFFVVEVASAFHLLLLLGPAGRKDSRHHRWILCLGAWISLVFDHRHYGVDAQIPGDWSWADPNSEVSGWHFFNPQFLTPKPSPAPAAHCF